MEHESTRWIQSGLLEKVRKSNTQISTRITTIRCEKLGSTPIEIKPRGVGTNTQGWAVGEAEIPANTLEEAIVVAMEIQARE